ncbi:universal stress protein [Sphingosinicella sp. YJ22]|uniref:universal stress protein n=1 Tax=Sphingosinicella sp. YJ22 TaxID=1104780 RepID=UPI00140E7B2E|nr:universal stress protein [Sphingosinicella sp. YJ22]
MATAIPSNIYRHILLPVDLDEPSSWAKAAPVALALAKCFDARLTIATVVPWTVTAMQAEWTAIQLRELIERARARLMLLADEIAPGLEIEKKVAEGSIYRGIIDLAEETDADLIVLASHRPAMRDYLIGANAASVVRHAACSVLVVRE